MRTQIAAALVMLLAGAGQPAQSPEGRTSKGGLRFTLDGRGADVVLIHAFQMDLREWDDMAAHLDGKRRVLRYDVRGHGRSDAIDPLPSSVEDLRSLLDELGISRATLVGCSMGSTIALDFALTYPNRVERLILLSPGIPGIKATASFDWMQPIIAAVKAKDPNGAAALWWESPLVAGLRGMPNAARYRSIILDNARIWTIPRPPPPLQPAAGQRLKDVGVPVIVAAGELDRSGSIENARAVADGVRRGTYIGVPNAGHMLSIERAELVSGWIQKH
jgi:pimeloyl-ACP methyl ester carboxylesterase